MWEKRDDENIRDRLLGQIERVMRKSAAVDKIIKNGIRQLIADYPGKYYFKSYLGSIL